MPPQGEREPRAKHVSRAVLLLAGVALGVFLVWKTGWAAVEANLASIGWWFFGLTALYLLAEIAFVLGWRAVMDPRPPLSSLPALLRIYLAGNTAELPRARQRRRTSPCARACCASASGPRARSPRWRSSSTPTCFRRRSSSPRASSSR